MTKERLITISPLTLKEILELEITPLEKLIEYSKILEKAGDYISLKKLVLVNKTMLLMKFSDKERELYCS